MEDAHPGEPASKPSCFERIFISVAIRAVAIAALVVVVPLLLDLLPATGGSLASREPERPPFEARYANLVLHIPDRPDLSAARKYDFGLIVRICDRSATEKAPLLCDVLSEPLVNRFGVVTHVTEPHAISRFTLLKERPKGVPSPEPVPLVIVPDSQVDRNIGGAGEAYELSRINTVQSGQLMTTDRGWPIAACSTHPLGTRNCTIGFLIAGAFIEAHVHADKGVSLNQLDVWAVASAVDAKLRALSTSDLGR